MARTLSAGNNLSNAGAVLTVVPISIACWFKPTTATGGHTMIELGSSVLTNRFSLDYGFTTGLVRAVVTASGTSNTASTAGAATIGAWNHFCAVFASSTDRRVFWNGGSKGTNATSRTPASIDKTLIGKLSSGLNEAAGDIAEMAVWSVTLSDAEVALLATGVSPYSVQRASVAAYWPLLGQASPEPDRVGAFPMTLAGTPPQVAHPFIFYGKDRLRRRGLVA